MTAAQARAKARKIAALLIRGHLHQEEFMARFGMADLDDRSKVWKELERLAQRLDPVGR